MLCSMQMLLNSEETFLGLPEQAIKFNEPVNIVSGTETLCLLARTITVN